MPCVQELQDKDSSWWVRDGVITGWDLLLVELQRKEGERMRK
jgi:hypothetical protein